MPGEVYAAVTHPIQCLHAEDWGMMRQSIIDMRESQQRLESSIEALTISVQASVTGVDQRVRLLENTQLKQAGFMTAVGIGASMLGALVMAGVNWLLRRNP
jgi:uncharacterized protein (TIGR03382 family)